MILILSCVLSLVMRNFTILVKKRNYLFPNRPKAALGLSSAKRPRRRQFEADSLLSNSSSVISSKIAKFACKYLNTDMKHLSTVGPPINSALIVIVLAIGTSFQIIGAQSTVCQQRLIA